MLKRIPSTCPKNSSRSRCLSLKGCNTCCQYVTCMWYEIFPLPCDYTLKIATTIHSAGFVLQNRQIYAKLRLLKSLRTVPYLCSVTLLWIIDVSLNTTTHFKLWLMIMFFFASVSGNVNFQTCLSERSHQLTEAERGRAIIYFKLFSWDKLT